MAVYVTLLDDIITTAGADVTTTPTDIVNFPANVTLRADFDYGSGGTTAVFRVQTSVDGGTTWADVANFAHATASLDRFVNLTAAAVTTPTAFTDGTLADNTTQNGLLGYKFRVKYTTVGTYAGSTRIRIYLAPSFYYNRR